MYSIKLNCSLQDLRHSDADIQKAELADMVDKEMIATSTAIEDAVLRMDVRALLKISGGLFITR